MAAAASPADRFAEVLPSSRRGNPHSLAAMDSQLVADIDRAHRAVDTGFYHKAIGLLVAHGNTDRSLRQLHDHVLSGFTCRPPTVASQAALLAEFPVIDATAAFPGQLAAELCGKLAERLDEHAQRTDAHAHSQTEPSAPTVQLLKRTGDVRALATCEPVLAAVRAALADNAGTGAGGVHINKRPLLEAAADAFRDAYLDAAVARLIAREDDHIIGFMVADEADLTALQRLYGPLPRVADALAPAVLRERLQRLMVAVRISGADWVTADVYWQSRRSRKEEATPYPDNRTLASELWVPYLTALAAR